MGQHQINPIGCELAVNSSSTSPIFIMTEIQLKNNLFQGREIAAEQLSCVTLARGIGFLYWIQKKLIQNSMPTLLTHTPQVFLVSSFWAEQSKHSPQ
nr:hypothetical protein Iba_chr11fCG0120 [Ipomoea batatas]GME02187.1 hypothetical protein Iba_scaffold1681092CG0010 [Ipomoea batatas]GME16752.1 hypothetical protein Iba_scaffold17844CG0660 [Ipomoea batatas]